MSNNPKLPGSLYPLQAGIGLALMAAGISALVLKNIYGTNPVPWIVGSIIILLCLFAMIRFRHEQLFKRLFKILYRIFGRNKETGWDDDDFNFDPNDFRDKKRRPNPGPEADEKGPRPDPKKSKSHAFRKRRP